MNRTRWLSLLLVVSWTLNVAFGVVFFIYHHRERRHPSADMLDGMPPCPPGLGMFPPGERDEIRAAMGPLAFEQRRISEELMETICDSTLDSQKVNSLNDSLGHIRYRMQEAMVHNVCRMHGRLPPEDYKQLCRRMIGKFEHGRPGSREREERRGEHERR